jgi:heme-degrading monooxygenase HmoA
MIKYVKYNKVRLKAGKRNESNETILEFFKEVQEIITEMKGFIVMDSLDDPSESIVLTFWETKKDMDKFYHKDNRILTDLVEKLKPSFEQLPERKDYQVSEFKFL